MNQNPDKSWSGIMEGLVAASRSPLWMTVALVVVALIVFGVTLNTATFVRAEDSILRLPLLSHYRHIPKIFGPDFMAFTEGRYRPFSYALLAGVRTFVSAENTIFWNVWLLAFHIVNAVLVYAVARRFAKRAESVLLAAAVFLLHPMASAFANQINLFADVLGGSLYLGSFLCYLRYARTRKLPIYVVGLILFVCGLLTARAVLTLPLLILLCELLYQRTGVLRTIGRLLPFGACALLLSFPFFTFHPHLVYYVYPKKPVVGAVRYWMYSFAGGADTFLALVRGRGVQAPVSGLVGDIHNTWNLTAMAIVLVAWLAASFRGLLKKHWAAVGTFLLLLSMLPRFHWAEHLSADYVSWSYQYLPLAGFALLAAACMDRLLAVLGLRWRQVVAAAAAALVLACAGFLFVANVRARTPKSYWHYALKVSPRSEVVSVKLGKAYLAEGREEEARHYLFSSPVESLRTSCLAMARHYSRKGESLAAIAHLRAARQGSAYGLRFQEDMLTSAEILERIGALDFAEYCLGQALMANPDNTVAFKQLAEILVMKGYLQAAAAILEKAVYLQPDDADAAERLASLHRCLYDPERHEVHVKITPPEPDWLRYATDQGVTRRILTDLISLADTHPRDPVIQLAVGTSLSQAQRHAEARRRFDRALKVLSSCPYAWATRCWAAASAGDTRLATEALEHVRHLKPRDVKLWNQLGAVVARLQRRELAVACFETVLKADPNIGEVHNNLAVVLASQGKYREAVPHFRKALALGESKLEDVHNGLGFVLMRLGQLDEAIVHCRKAIEIDPGLPHGYRTMAKAFERKGRFAESIRTLSEGLKAVPGDPSLQINLAWLLATVPEATLRDGPRAVRLAETICRRADPVTPEQLDLLAACYAETGEFDKATTTAARAESLARAQGRLALARQIEQRRLLYRSHKSLRIAVPPEQPQ